MVWLWILEEKFGPILTGDFTCHVDNDTVVGQVNQGRPETKVTTKRLATNYDLWIERTMEVLDHVHCGQQVVHVKGHQGDDFIVKGKQFGPLNHHAFWNIQIDKFAAQTKRNGTSTLTPFLELSKIVLMLNGNAVMISISRVIQDALHLG